jgi:uncharacterized protein (DUF111 family)
VTGNVISWLLRRVVKRTIAVRHFVESLLCANVDVSFYHCLGYAVTIVVEGGVGTLEVVENDIKAKRPIVLIQVCFSNR